MVVVKLIGGLGNQMFQYATGLAIAKQNNTQLQLDISAFKDYKLRTYGLNHFNLDAVVYKQPSRWIKKIKNKISPNTYYNETSFRYNADLFNVTAKQLFLNGHFQSENYFLNIRHQILKEFTITSPLKPKTQAILNDLKQTDAVSIHIRRGDFLNHNVHNTSKDVYYRQAMQLMESKVENPTYFLFSDDMKWVKANFKTNHPTVFIDFNDAKTAYQDMILMSNCKHNIIANSSFSWWSAWLNVNLDKIVIAPKQWFNGDKYDYTDVVPESWIKI